MNRAAGTWPVPLPADAPFGDEACEPWDGFEDFERAGGTLGREAYAARVAEVRALLDAVAAGRRAGDAHLRDLLGQVLVPTAPTVDRRVERPVPPRLPAMSDLARVATDVCPAAAAEAHDRVLGPLADTLDAHRPGDRATLLASVAGYVFSVADGDRVLTRPMFEPGLSPFEQWCNRQPIPPAEDREVLRAVGLAPWSAWSLERRTPDGRWVLADRVGLGPRAVPDGPVRLLEPGAPWREARPGDTLAARVLEGPDGWCAATAIVFPGGPPAARIHAWVALELCRGRILDRRLSVDQLLRRRGHELVRRLSEWAWLAGDDDPYRDPVLYDLEYRDHDEDLAWYLELARSAGGPVLELGCGTGRLLLHLARHGVEVRGVDRSAAMLEGLGAKVAREPGAVRRRISVHEADFCRLPDLGRFALVLLPFNALHHCRSDEEVQELLGGIRRALHPGGRVGLDCYLPDLELYDRDPEGRYEVREFVDPRTGEPLVSWEQGWWDAETRVHHVVYVYERSDGTREQSHLQLRMFELPELRAHFRQAGLRPLLEARDYRGGPITARALKYVTVLTEGSRTTG